MINVRDVASSILAFVQRGINNMSIMKSHLEGINLNQQSNSGGATFQTNSIIQGGGSLYPYYQQNYMYTATIRKVSNGYVLTVGSSEYVFESVDNMVSKLKDVLEPKKDA